MHRTTSRSIATLLALAALLSGAFGAAPNSPIVILISVDGLAAFHLDDPRADLPTIRWMAENGARADGMETSFPSVTWTTHTSLVTGVFAGRHGVLGNSYYDRAQNKKIPLIMDPLFDKEELVKVPTVYDVAHRAGFRTAGVNWPASRNARHLDWQVPDVGDPIIYEKAGTPSLRAELKAAGIPIEKQSEWVKSPTGKAMRDWLYTRIAGHILRTHRPNLLVLHLVTVDAFAHSDGGRSPEVAWAVNDSDNRIRELIETVKSAGLAERTTFFITADHGFADYTKNINLNALLRAKGWLTTAGNAIVDSKVYFLAQGGGGFIYIRNPAERDAIMAELVPALKAVEGIEAVIPASEFAQVGHVPPERNPHEPDILVAAAAGYNFADNPASKELIVPTGGVKGTHGNHPANPLMDATFVAWGAAIKPGVRLGRIRNVDVAPTMAAVLGLEMAGVEGRVLTEILGKP